MKFFFSLKLNSFKRIFFDTKYNKETPIEKEDKINKMATIISKFITAKIITGEAIPRKKIHKTDKIKKIIQLLLINLLNFSKKVLRFSIFGFFKFKIPDSNAK